MATQEIYYIPEGSKWPIVGTLSLFITFLGGAMMFNSVDAGKYVLIVGLAALTYMFAGWFADVISESIAGKYSKQVDISFRMGMGWFILSEVMLFSTYTQLLPSSVTKTCHQSAPGLAPVGGELVYHL